MRANLSILGLYQYDSTILNGLINALPKDPETGDDLIKADVLVNNILLECAELEVCYPEPETMRNAISVWAQLRTSSWLRIAQALDSEYNPIHNYDRYENIERTYTPGAGYTNSFTDPEYTDTVTQENPGYNSNALVSAVKSTSSHEVDTDSSFTHTPDGKSDSDKYVNHLYGNIGVTTAAQMIDGELEIRKNDIYNIITNEFRRRFCLLVY